MLPALGLVSLAWTLACLVPSATSAVFDTSECCVCNTFFPSNTPVGTKPQVMPSPFKIEFNKLVYLKDDEIVVTLKATQGYQFRSFMLGAYVSPWREGAKPVGQLIVLEDDVKTEDDCTQTATVSANRVVTFNALISRDKKPKSVVKFSWIPMQYHGHIEFRATFVMNDEVYWVGEKSKLLIDATMPVDPKDEGKRPGVKFIPEINTAECGKSKGCYREPSGCSEYQCLYILTWRRVGTDIELELGGLADGNDDRYVAVGLSEDKYMGEDTVFTCAHNSAEGDEMGVTKVYVSRNEDDPKRNEPLKRDSNGGYSFIKNPSGLYYNARLRCRFTVNPDLDRRSSNKKEKVFLPQTLRGGPKHLLFARGYAVGGNPERHGLGVEELPIASEDPVSLTRNKDYSGRASYPLAKAHGCLMIIAWVFFASIGLLMTKYYKTMWPNKRVYEQRYWFITHFNCMATMFIITIIGIILIFVEADGWSEAPDLPQKAHPILGIIILICIIINPILALLRPSEDSKCRPVFNWFHWAFGTIANVLAIPQIFIGMDFGKVQVPWWATWILVIWVIFHIIVELTLEIHQCCTHKKNKERRKKWELLKREYPKQHHPEPEPAGRRFKRFMLCLHVCFTTLITLIMVIVIAVS